MSNIAISNDDKILLSIPLSKKNLFFCKFWISSNASTKFFLLINFDTYDKLSLNSSGEYIPTRLSPKPKKFLFIVILTKLIILYLP